MSPPGDGHVIFGSRTTRADFQGGKPIPSKQRHSDTGWKQCRNPVLLRESHGHES